MSAHYIPSSLELMDGAEPAIGAVYSSKRRYSLAGQTHGCVGWRATLESGGLVSMVEVFFYNKGGFAKWLTRAEFEQLKAERASAWKIVNGPAYYRAQCRKRDEMELITNRASFAT